jgi:GNAT superfamily N-acetyltransferase
VVLTKIIMSALTVKPVSTRRERQQFLRLPWDIYRGDPHWIPPIRLDEEELVGYRHHPFYERNKVQTFLAFRDDTAIGRIAAILNEAHNDHHHERRGFFGFFECEENKEAATALFDAVKGWLAERGITRMRGPMNPSVNYTLGTLVEGFDSPPTFMMTYNPPYYPRLLEACGLVKVQDLYAYYAYRDMLPRAREKMKPIYDQVVERYGVLVRGLDRRRFLDDVEAFLQTYNRSMSHHWSYCPLTEGEVRHMAKALRWLIVPDLTAFAELDGKLVGVILAMLDYNPRIRAIGGRLFPFGFLRLLWNRRRIKRMRMLAANVVPEYQLMGIGLALLGAMVRKCYDWGLEEAEFSWVAESNHLSRGSLEKGGAKRLKTYRVYDWGA